MKVMRMLSGLQRSPNEFIPVHKHLRSCQQRLTIWDLPEEILIHLLKSLHVKDLLSMRQVHPYFRDLIDNSQSIWACVTFQESWPSSVNLQHFDKAAEVGNIEALVKLAIAYLYNEGLQGDNDGKKVSRNGTKAAEMFCRVESLTPNTDPFTWLFIRPPWSLNGACCKECVFNYMKEYLKKDESRKMEVCVAKTLQLLDKDKNNDEIVSYLEQAASQGSGIAAYMLWSHTKCNFSVLDKAGELECIRKLRDICSLGHIDAKLELCKYYAVSKYGGICKSKAMSFIRDFVHSVPALNTQESFQRSQELTASMRYILVDWLAEVAAMKLFSTHTFHVAVGVVDRFLQVNSVPRSKLQLLGVSAMVLCSRLLGSDIITIREAAWLTDNTYKYEDVVRMMGEITATLRGNLRTATSVDFAEIFNTILSHDRRLCYLSQYICELALLQAEMGQYSPAETAASAVLLSRLLTKMDDAWPSTMQEATGFCIEDLNRCAFHMHEKCFLEGSVVDHRDVTLQAVKQRYADDDCCRVSEIEIISYKDLCKSLGVTHHIVHGMDIHVRFRNDDELIVSPQKKRRRTGLRSESNKTTSTPKTPRTRLHRPVIDSPMLNDSPRLNESVLSGYDGDREDDLDDSIIIDESIEDLKREVLSDEGMLGNEGDHISVFSSDNTRSPQKSTFNFSAPSPFKQCLSFSSSKFDCDYSSQISSSQSSHDSDGPSTSMGLCSSSDNSAFSTSFINLRSTSMTLRSATVTSGACGSLSSDSECDISGLSGIKRLKSSRSPRHMTLRNTPKRRSRRISGGSRTFIFK
ncbi:cyclin-F-like isoform X2 [Mercenaria mercenaria]|uniref:cyclin-F-like isoform X2 n=1 Tax=Mercenaria mercenaria TaxID=6596 RepID=UPI001E1D7050|nr:cyclin-F-like isoform X2 [Mercenaria mercenaria]